jgi:hypothetical protein
MSLSLLRFCIHLVLQLCMEDFINYCPVVCPDLFYEVHSQLDRPSQLLQAELKEKTCEELYSIFNYHRS